MSLVGSQRYSDEGCTDVDYVELMSNQSSFQVLPLEKSPDILYQKKPWGDLAHCSLHRKHLCHDWQLLYDQFSNLQRWIFHCVPQQSKDSFLVLIILHTDHLFLKTLVPESTLFTDELWLRQHWNSSILVHRTFALSGKALLLGGQLLKLL